MEDRKHDLIHKNLFKKPYFFSQWCYCTRCGYIQHFEKYKVKKEDYQQFLIDIEKKKAADRNQPTLI